ncbi:MAG TPA: hypothetical protein VM537_19590 [Anaerolineae bacterium]|nr:hypothetical protein [Anaerolineae bacterium]
MPYENGVWRPHAWEDWEIDLIDGSLDTVGVLDEAAGMAISWAQFGKGDGSLALHLQSALAEDLLAAGMWYFRFIRDGVQIRDFMLAKDDRGYNVSNQYIDEYITLALSPLDMVLKDKRCIPEQTALLTNFASPSLPLDDGFKWIVDHVCGPNAYPGPGGVSRVLAGLTIAANLSAHPTTDTITQFHKMDLFEALQKFGPTWDIDWRVRMEKTSGTANQMVFETFYPIRGLDKTEDNYAVRQPMILNDASGEVISARRYRPAVGFYNVILSKAMNAEVKDTTSVSSYGRREVLADSNEAEKLDALLEERSQRIGDEYEFTESEMVQIGAEADEFQPGDTVTIGNHHLDIPARDETIQEIKFALQDQGIEKATITFGRYEKSLPDKIAESGGGGGGASAIYDPIMGLKDTAGTFVPYSNDDDYIYVQLTNSDGYVDLVGDIATNKITVNLKAHPLVAMHTITGQTPGHVLTVLTADTFGWAAVSPTMLASPDAEGWLHSDGVGGLSWRSIVFEQATEPVSPLPGDIWIDTDDSPAGGYWTRSGTTLYPTTASDSLEIRNGGGAVFTVAGADGDTTWAPSAIMTWEGKPYQMPTDAPAAGEALVVSSTGSPNVLAWGAPTVTAHNVLSTTHGDSTAGNVARGDLITGQGATPKWVRLALGSSGQFLKSDGTDIVWGSIGHTLTGSIHSESGLTTGHVLKATGATTFAFGAITKTMLPSHAHTMNHGHGFTDTKGYTSLVAGHQHDYNEFAAVTDHTGNTGSSII